LTQSVQVSKNIEYPLTEVIELCNYLIDLTCANEESEAKYSDSDQFLKNENTQSSKDSCLTRSPKLKLTASQKSTTVENHEKDLTEPFKVSSEMAEEKEVNKEKTEVKEDTEKVKEEEKKINDQEEKEEEKDESKQKKTLKKAQKRSKSRRKSRSSAKNKKPLTTPNSASNKKTVKKPIQITSDNAEEESLSPTPVVKRSKRIQAMQEKKNAEMAEQLRQEQKRLEEMAKKKSEKLKLQESINEEYKSNRRRKKRANEVCC
jgi:PREDICTED: hypothetical protein